MPVRWRADELQPEIEQAVWRGVVRGTEMLRNEAIRLILSPPKTGRKYQRRGIIHQASAPGEAPASDTGYLVNSITTTYSRGELMGIVNFGADYAPYLEFGTQTMEPRPFVRPTVDLLMRDVIDGIAAEVKLVTG